MVLHTAFYLCWKYRLATLLTPPKSIRADKFRYLRTVLGCWAGVKQVY